jgi:hypothetical protein
LPLGCCGGHSVRNAGELVGPPILSNRPKNKPLDDVHAAAAHFGVNQQAAFSA